MNQFKVQGQLGLDGSGFFSTLDKARGAVGSFGGMLAGAFSVGAITAFSKSVLDLAGKLNDVSDALGINVEFLQRFVNSAAKSGGSLEDVEKFIFESNKSRQEALNNPNSKDAKAFQQLGFTEQDIGKLNPQQFIEKLIAAFADGATAADINALSDIGGRSAKKLVGGFKDGLDNATEIINESLVAELDAIGDRFTSIGTTIKSFFAPALKMAADAIEYVLDKLKLVQEFYGALIGGVQGGQSFKQSFEEAIDAREAKRAELADARAREAETRAAAREAKKERDSAPLNLEAQAKEQSFKREKMDKAYSDSRLAVGGFLGQGMTSSLANIAERQLVVQREQLSLAKMTLDAIKSGKVPLTLFIP